MCGRFVVQKWPFPDEKGPHETEMTRSWNCGAQSALIDSGTEIPIFHGKSLGHKRCALP